MKICRIIYAYKPFQLGGADIYAGKISREVENCGHETVIISINPECANTVSFVGKTKVYRFHPGNVSTIHRVGKRSSGIQALWTLFDIYNPCSYFAVKSILKREKPDLVHVHTPVDFTLSVFDAVKSCGLPLVYTLHDYLLLCRRIVLLHGNGEVCTPATINSLCKAYRWVARSVVNRSVDRVISPSEFTLALHRKNGYFVNTDSHVLPHGIVFDEKFRQLHAILKRDRKDVFTVLYVGGLSKNKGVHVLIKAFRLLSTVSARLHIVGDGIERNRLEMLAANDPRIIFYGKIANEQIISFYMNADVVVVPSIWYEVRSNVVAEAFRLGIPVIASNIGALPEFVRNGLNGFLFESGDVNNLYDILTDIVNNPQQLSALGKNTYATIQQSEMTHYITDLVGIYRDVIDKKKRMQRYHLMR